MFSTFFGVKTWNDIPKDIRSLDSRRAFCQNTLPTYTVNTRRFDLNELKKVVVCGWQFFVDHGLRVRVVENLYLETGYF